MQQQDRPYDLVVWGATGFTGRLVVEYLYQQYGLGGELSWAAAGRDEARLRAILAEVGCPTLPVMVADSFDLDSLMALAAQTRVVCTTVGPYTRYGSLLVQASVAAGAHYCDLSGEVGWMRRMIDEHHAAAQAAGVKIVHSCGFDSIPSDLGVYFLQREALARFGQYAQRVSGRVKAAKGGFSGGTYASMTAQLAIAATDRSFARLLANPYALNPDPAHQGSDPRDLRSVVLDPASGAWIAPFVMAGINTRVVRRSHALAGFPYGPQFTYDEALITGRGWRGKLVGNLMTLGLGLAMTAKPGSFMRRIVDWLMPKPGEGPSRQAIENGFFTLVFYGFTADGRRIETAVKGRRDPGYGATARMLAECAVCLAKDQAGLPPVFGVLTPSIALGDALLQRLPERAQVRFELRP